MSQDTKSWAFSLINSFILSSHGVATPNTPLTYFSDTSVS